MADVKSAASLITKARKRAGITQSELARRAQTSQPAVNRYERGRVVPSERTLSRILQACEPPRRRPSEVLSKHRDRVLRLVREAGATKVLVFGSVARGDDDEDSDIDLLVDHLDPDEYSWLQPKVKEKLETLLGCRVDIGEIPHLRNRVLELALRDARPL